MALLIRCWIRRPEGPAPVNFGKDLRAVIMLMSEGSLVSTKGMRGTDGHALAGPAVGIIKWGAD